MMTSTLSGHSMGSWENILRGLRMGKRALPSESEKIVKGEESKFDALPGCVRILTSPNSFDGQAVLRPLSETV
jgi:hypothetical protein